MTAYTNVPKPTGANYTNVSKSVADYPQYGSAIYGISHYGVTDEYTRTAKPTGTPYINVPKPTI